MLHSTSLYIQHQTVAQIRSTIGEGGSRKLWTDSVLSILRASTHESNIKLYVIISPTEWIIKYSEINFWHCQFLTLLQVPPKCRKCHFWDSKTAFWKRYQFPVRNTKWLKNGKLRRAILSAFYNISQRNFGILLILWCSFKLWWNVCLDLSRSKFCSLGNRSIVTSSFKN
jgi:hypothetical protein